MSFYIVVSCIRYPFRWEKEKQPRLFKKIPSDEAKSLICIMGGGALTPMFVAFGVAYHLLLFHCLSEQFLLRGGVLVEVPGVSRRLFLHRGYNGPQGLV
ncbi:hypothetical protein FA13DRAFT_313808 [Coprinellus micaceus]|uniref:Uncharacterized protein n=1 Tax=Coprinellus micaceus TaxID=71717 RepID=A0A4Y7TCJ4_COPMI|nr:hypothetical protein FA13DRAFT_313808 [Coprinellus micaceus]